MSGVSVDPLCGSPAFGLYESRSLLLAVVSNGSDGFVVYSGILVPFALKSDWSHCVGDAVLDVFGGGGGATSRESAS